MLFRSVTGRISAANIEHGIRMVFFIDTVCRAQHHRAAAVRTTHCVHARNFRKRVSRRIFLQNNHQPFSTYKCVRKKKPEGPKTAYRVKVAEIVVSHQPIDSVMIGCLPAIRFFACAVWNGSTRHSVTAPYPFGHVLAAGRLRPRRKPERKLFYMVSVPYPPGKVKQKTIKKCLFL